MHATSISYDIPLFYRDDTRDCLYGDLHVVLGARTMFR
jgi:hypothetical protein